MRIGSRRAACAFLPVLLFGLLLPPAALSQGKKHKGTEQTRSVEGVVTQDSGAVVNGAVVQLKNTKTLEIRSYFTKNDGQYYFNGLSPDINYELKASYQGASSGTKTLSSFDSRKEARINLKLNNKK